MPSKTRYNLYGLVIAFISNILGIGGGIITVPTLLYHHTPERRAIGTSAATGGVITLLGALSYLYFGLKETSSLPSTVGFIYVPAFLIVAITSSITAPYGALLTQRLPSLLLHRLLGIALIVTGLVMLFI